MKKVLFIDRDGTLILEPDDFQVDSIEKLTFFPGVLSGLGRIAKELDYELVMVSNQDGLGTDKFPFSAFNEPHQILLKALRSEGIEFVKECIDITFPEENSNTRKPNTGMLEEYLNSEYDLESSFVIGDRYTDVELAKNLNSRAILLKGNPELGVGGLTSDLSSLEKIISLKTDSWEEIYAFLSNENRRASVKRKTKETSVSIECDLDGIGRSQIYTGIAFFDHMLCQIAQHGQMDLFIDVKGDLEVDEHHTIEDTAIALGECFQKALGNKAGIERYGFCLPMDDCLAQVALDFGGRNWLVWDVTFNREMIGGMPTEMFLHFFKSFTDVAKCNLNIKAEGFNEHHKIEAIFKAFAKAIKMAKKRELTNKTIPSTKGVI